MAAKRKGKIVKANDRPEDAVNGLVEFLYDKTLI